MGKLFDKHEELYNEVVRTIEKLLGGKKGVVGRSGKFVLKIENSAHLFNIEGGRFLVEINTRNLIDNYGYEYSLDALTLEQLCEVVDGLE